jgi:hypothetical protein
VRVAEALHSRGVGRHLGEAEAVPHAGECVCVIYIERQ